MNKKNYPICFMLLVVLLSFSKAAIAQTVDVFWGPVLKEPRKTYTSKIIGSDKKGFFTLRSNPSDKEMFLERYDLNNKLEFSRELIIPLPENSKDKKLKFESIYYLDGQLVLFSSNLNEKTNRNVAYASKVSQDGQVENNAIEVGLIENATKRSPGNFSFVLSKDSTKILAYTEADFNRKETQKLEYKVLDNKLNIVIDKEVTLPVLSKDFEILNYTLDDDANVYILVNTRITDAARNNKEQGTLYKVMAFYADKSHKEYEIKIQNKFITNITFKVDSHKDLLVSGFYGDTWKSGPGNVFFIKIAYDTRKFVAQGVKKLTPEILALFMNKNKATRDDAGIGGLTIKQLEEREDGGALLIAEQSWVEVVRGSSGKNGYTPPTYHYYSNEIFFVSISPTGNIDWITCIPKQQHTKDDNGMYNSYSMNLMGGNIFMIYNDHIGNIEIEDPRKLQTMRNPGKAVTMLVTLDANGKFTRKVLFPAKDQKTIVRPTYYTRGQESIIIYSEVGRDYRFGNLKFN